MHDGTLSVLPAGAPSTSACNEEVQVAAVDVGIGEAVGALVGAAVDVGAGEAVGALVGATVDVGAAAAVGWLLGGVVGPAAGCCVGPPGLGGEETGTDVAPELARAVATVADGEVELAAAPLDAAGAPELACTWLPPRAGGAMRAEL